MVLGLDIHDGKLSEFQTIVQKMVAVSETEADALTYVLLLSPNQKHCRLIEAYNDDLLSQSTSVWQFVPQLLDVAHLAFVEFHGDLGPRLLLRLHRLNPQALQSGTALTVERYTNA